MSQTRLNFHDLDQRPDTKIAEGPVVPVTVVVPCFNEEEGIGQLATRLVDLVHEMRRDLAISVVLVDDGSTDETWRLMRSNFSDHGWATLLRHGENRGIAAASLTGIRAAKDELVAVIDSDCTYDPALIREMVPLLDPDVSLVTASPYHPRGRVEGAPRWRIRLSYWASRAYRTLLRNKISTYTSCFRLYRRSAVIGISQRHSGFIGVAETLALLDREGWRIREVPAVLTGRRFGQSKLRVSLAVLGHLNLMSQIAFARMTRNWKPAPESRLSENYSEP